MAVTPPLSAVVDSRAEQRRRRLRAMREHHPDLGGDTAAFVEALRHLDEGLAVDAWPEVRFAKRRRWWQLVEPPRPFRRRRGRPRVR